MYVSTFHHKNENAVLGEKYTMRYNINDPDMIEVDYWHPIFEPNEKTHRFKATITSIHKVIPLIQPLPFVVFIFDVVYEDNEVEHVKRYAILPMNYKQLYPNLKEGNQYVVECLEDNIYRMVLHLDKPIKK
jgi:hypothetical protein